jgi:signal transduction histidine kinase
MNPADHHQESISKWVAFVLERERLRYSDDLFHGLIHNINSPLQNISMLVEFMEAEFDRSYELLCSDSEKEVITRKRILERERQWLQKLSGQVSALDIMLRDLRVLSEIERNATEVDLKLLVSSLTQFFRCDLFFKHNVQFELKLKESLPLIRVLGMHLVPALVHLFQNAMIAMRRVPDKHLVIESRLEAKTIWLSFRDSGCGLKPGEEHRCFDLFYSGWPPEDQKLQKHYGVGLFLASLLLEPYGVKIRLHMEGQETVASLEIPINTASHPNHWQQGP